MSSGDGYNRRFEAVLEGFERKERCIDDTVFYDNDLERHWWRTIDFMIRVGQSGIVLNPDKFQFCQREVAFAGFNISDQRVEPLPKYLNAIRMFPTPKTSTDIRSWFGLVNQLATYAQLRDIMAPFRPFLSPKVKFEWNEKLDAAFQSSKESIVAAIRHGVQIFEINRPTCVRPDWSRRGIGYFLSQKHCKCTGKLPDCCRDGWKVTLAGSRFLSDTESRYAAVEGEALAIAWSLEQTRYFTQGCSKLLVVTDHKPLVKLFGDRTLDEITNTRLFRLKQRTLQWHFDIAYCPGKTNLAADATSRNPCAIELASNMSVGDLAEHLTIASIHDEATSLTSVSWETVATETEQDHVLSELSKAIQEGFQGSYDRLSQFMRYKNSLCIQDGVIIYQDRVVIPKSLRHIVLDSLHAAHQGVSSMLMRAQAIVFWPGMSYDISEKRRQCYDCNRNAPSQAALPSEPASPPSAPFEEIFADFCDYGGHHYLVAGDRLSGFTEVFSTPSGSSNAGSHGLIKCLRKWFGTFGVPRQLSSDGGPEFSSDSTAKFLKLWGVAHRISSAYNPSSNGRAEVAVKSVKRLLASNVGRSGTLNTDRFLRAILQFRNTPDPDCGVSPAEIVFGHTLRDNLLFTDYIQRQTYSKRWQQAWTAKEEALRARFIRSTEDHNQHARDLPPLTPGDRCFVQNQKGNFPKKWHYTGTVMEVQSHDRYIVKMDGSGQTTCRNRKFLKLYTPASLVVEGKNQRPPIAPDLRRPIISGKETTTTQSNVSTPDVIERRPVYPDRNHTPSVNHSHPLDSPASEAVAVHPRVTQGQVPVLPKKPPLAVRQLQDYNARGLKESIVHTPEQDHQHGFPRRSNRLNN